MAINCPEGPFVFRLNENTVGPHLLVQVCTERGWREYAGDSSAVDKDRWNLWWRSGGIPLSQCKSLLPWQFINRIPKGSSICRKDKLARHLKCMRRIHGSIYNFMPSGYNLPSEYTKLAADCSRHEKDDKIWICKPVSQSQGRGIFLFRRLSDLTYDSIAIAQRYIENPLLIGGYKFDLRLYVCVPSYRPLVIYIYKEGLARFATQKFSLEALEDPFRHLTNFSLNKLGPGYSEKKERVGAGCKWTFRQLRRYFEQSGYYDWFLWQRIACLVSLTILSQAAGIPRCSNCFEFFGFDVLIDGNLKPWLLEVNLSPALSNDCEIDSEVKKPLLHDLFDLLGLPVCNTGLSLFKLWKTIPEESVRFYHGRSEKRRNKNVADSTSSFAQSRGFLPKESIAEDCTQEWMRSSDAHARRPSKSEPNVFWDNGRDWRNPCPTEGGWIRVYPVMPSQVTEDAMSDCDRNSLPRFIDKNIKNAVLSIQKYLKVAREAEKKYSKQGDERCNDFLQRTLQLDSEVWLPDK